MGLYAHCILSDSDNLCLVEIVFFKDEKIGTVKSYTKKPKSTPQA